MSAPSLLLSVSLSLSHFLFCIASHGTGHQLLKAGSKRRKTKAEIVDAKLAEDMRRSEVENITARNQQLERELIASQQQS